jgi:hypothetical protein
MNSQSSYQMTNMTKCHTKYYEVCRTIIVLQD